MTNQNTISFSTLPVLRDPLDGGVFAGLTTRPDGTHCAVVLLPEQAEKLTWKNAMNWAKKLGAELPNRAVAAMFFANVNAHLNPKWHWTSDAYDASYAWGCYFGNGDQFTSHKSYEGSAVAVRLIPITA